MPLRIASLNSGSNGNCYYIANDSEAVLVDVGISCHEVEKRMKRMGLAISKVKAIFISHEHGDHIHGVPALSKKHRLPVYITQRTLSVANITIEGELIKNFGAHENVCIGSLTVVPFPKSHDGVDAHSFTVSSQGITVGVFTDIAYACEHVKENFARCHAAFLETNYDDAMLDNGGYPPSLKNRIRNGKGHLSNAQAAKLFQDHSPEFMSHLFLSHLSRNNNRPEIALELFNAMATKTEIVLAPRDRETELFTIDFTGRSNKKFRTSIKQQQLTLF